MIPVSQFQIDLCHTTIQSIFIEKNHEYKISQFSLWQYTKPISLQAQENVWG